LPGPTPALRAVARRSEEKQPKNVLNKKTKKFVKIKKTLNFVQITQQKRVLYPQAKAIRITSTAFVLNPARMVGRILFAAQLWRGSVRLISLLRLARRPDARHSPASATGSRRIR
jgi:hypothetical protein